jgi:hypothetical protein
MFREANFMEYQRGAKGVKLKIHNIQHLKKVLS